MNSNEKPQYPFVRYGTCVGKYISGNFVLSVHDGQYDFYVITNNLTLDEFKKCRPHAGQKVAVLIEGDTSYENEYGSQQETYVGRALLLDDSTKIPGSYMTDLLRHRTIGALTWFLFFIEQGIISPKALYELVWRLENNEIPKEVQAITKEWLALDPRNDRTHDLKYQNLIRAVIGMRPVSEEE